MKEHSEKGKIYGPGDYSRKGTTYLSADVCVVGTGSAGAVVAAVLASAGVDVLVLEEGPYYASEDFNQLEHLMIPALYRESANQMEECFNISVMQGRCVGGSPVVNMADCVMTPRPVHEHWIRYFGYAGPSYCELSKANEINTRRMNVNKIPEEELNENNRLLLESARSLGLSARTFENNRVNCVGCGYCLIGCHYRAKQSTLVTFVEDALKDGVRLFSRARAERFVWTKGRARVLEGVFLEKDSDVPMGRFEIRAHEFVLAAGAIHSPLVLMQSGIQIEGIGDNLSLQPQMPVMALFEKEIVAYRGIPQAAVVDAFEEIDDEKGLSGFRIEGIMAGPAMSSSFGPGSGLEFKQLMTRFRHIAAALILFPDRPSGYVRVKERGRALIKYRFSDELARTIRKGLKEAARIYLHAGARLVAFPTLPGVTVKSLNDLHRIDSISFTPAHVRMISAHPQGTLRMSERGPVRPDFRLRGFENLYVCDSSIFPTTSSSHIMLPVMAYARVAADRLIQAL